VVPGSKSELELRRPLPTFDTICCELKSRIRMETPPPPQTTHKRLDANGAREEVVRALGRLEQGERNALEGVRLALCPLIAALRADGMSFDSIVETVRALISKPTTPEAEFGLHPAAREALVELSVQWCANEYGQHA
jgi:hypothetical protein